MFINKWYKLLYENNDTNKKMFTLKNLRENKLENCVTLCG